MCHGGASESKLTHSNGAIGRLQPIVYVASATGRFRAESADEGPVQNQAREVSFLPFDRIEPCWSPFMTHRATLIPGDGIGPEVAAATVEVLAAAGVAIDWDTREAGVSALETRCV